jgi:FkbM family methyltransferase
MSYSNLQHTEVQVRNVSLKLMTYTRSLELCARMNYETENLDFIDKIKPGEILFDLGACEGRFSIYAAKKGVKVFSFEPEAKNFQALTQNVALNSIPDSLISTINAGVGEKNARLVMNIGQPWEGGHQKVVNHGEKRADLNFNFVSDQEIDIVSLDAFIDSGAAPSPDYLKVDIDGSEVPFLMGALKTLGNKNLKGIIFELEVTDSHFDFIYDLMSKNFFKEFGRFPIPNEPQLFNFVFYRA